MKKTIIHIFFAFAIFAFATSAGVNFASAEVSNGDDDGANAPAQTSNPSGGEVINGADDGAGTPEGNTQSSTSGDVSNGEDDNVATPSGNTPSDTDGSISNGDDDTAGVNPPPGNNGDDDDDDDDNGGGGSRGGGSRGPSSSGGSPTLGVTIIRSTPVFISSTTTCPLISTYMKLGGVENNGGEVAKLQSFLKNREELDVDVTGIFDQKTHDAVIAFQKKYLLEVMGPWDATRPSGFVYITTSKKINQLACAQPLVLTSEEIAIIEAYKDRLSSGDISISDIGSLGTSGTTTAQVGDESVDEEGNRTNTAAVSDASILQRFWEFLKHLFR